MYLAALGLSCSTLDHRSIMCNPSLWCMDSLVVGYGLRAGVAWAYLPCGLWSRTWVSCIARWILNHRTTREVPTCAFKKNVLFKSSCLGRWEEPHLLCILGSKVVIPVAVMGEGEGPPLPFLCPVGTSLSFLASLALPSTDGATFRVKTLRFKRDLWTCLYVHAQRLSHVWLCNPVDYNLTGSSIHGILQARILECVAMPSSRRHSSPRDGIRISCTARRISDHWTAWEVHEHFGDHTNTVMMNIRYEPRCFWSQKLWLDRTPWAKSTARMGGSSWWAVREGVMTRWPQCVAHCPVLQGSCEIG